MRRLLIVVVGIAGGFGLLAAAHHFVVMETWHGDGALADAAAATCSTCHGGAYSTAPRSAGAK